MRADRLLSLLLLLQVHRRMTARELAKRLEVSERTIYRDVQALSSTGVPLTTERGTGGGIVLAEAFRTNLTGLNVAEIQALFVGRPTNLLSDLGLQQASEAALIKLQAVLPSVVRHNAEYVRQRIYVDVVGWQRAEDEPLTYLPVLQEAIWQERRVCIDYQRADGAARRVLDPLGLVAKGRIWYLVAAVQGEPRTYRIARIQQAQLLDEPCLRPPAFDLAGYWQRSSAEFMARLPRYVVSVRTRQQVLDRLIHAGRFIRLEQVGEPDEDGWLDAHLAFELPAEACGYLLSFGTEIEICAPLELRERVIALAGDLATFYARRALAESAAR
jgi:predicted DNA-binding transcriptional regulator YafY